MTPRAIAVAVLCLALAGRAGAEETPVSPQAFRDYAEGHTLYFSESGTYYGAESYHPGDRAIWQYGLGDCVRGTWRAHGAQICFLYEDNTDEVCWRLLRDDQGLFARLLGDDGGEPLELRIVRRDRQPLRCGGPSV